MEVNKNQKQRSVSKDHTGVRTFSQQNPLPKSHDFGVNKLLLPKETRQTLTRSVNVMDKSVRQKDGQIITFGEKYLAPSIETS